MFIAHTYLLFDVCIYYGCCFSQDVFLMIRRKKTTVFMDAKESTPVLEMKKMLQGITKKLPEDMRLFKDDQVSQ